jgi:hypothetical protein
MKHKSLPVRVLARLSAKVPSTMYAATKTSFTASHPFANTTRGRMVASVTPAGAQLHGEAAQQEKCSAQRGRGHVDGLYVRVESQELDFPQLDPKCGRAPMCGTARRRLQ